MTQQQRLTLVLPWAVLVSTNQRTNPAGWGPMKGRQFLTQRYRQAKAAAELLVAGQTRGHEVITGPVSVELDFYPPDRRRRDPDNLLKLIQDAMSGLVYDDDHQIRSMRWELRAVDRDNARVEIRVGGME